MADLTDNRLKEMEEEMTRFEEEILSTTAEEELASHSGTGNGISFHSPSPMNYSPSRQQMSSPSAGTFSQAPIFVPPQLKNRPMPPPLRPPMHVGPVHPGVSSGFPMNMGSFAGPAFHGPQHTLNRVPPPSFNLSSPQKPSELQTGKGSISSSSLVVSAMKVVYSAPPIRNTEVKNEFEEKKLEEKPVVPPVMNIVVDSPFKPSKEVDKVKPHSLKTTSQAVTNHKASATPKETKTQSTSAAITDHKKDKKDKKKKYMRMAAGNIWEDPTLTEWDPDDFRLFCGDLGNEVTDDVLNRVFAKYPSFQKARVIRDKRTNKTKGYGFASFKDPGDFMKAIRELNGKYVGNRPIKLRKSCWQERQVENVKRKEREKKKLGFR